MPVSISLGTFFVELAIFLLSVFVMERFVFAPIRAAWRERDRLIQEGLQAAGQSREEAERARSEVERILAAARRTAQSETDAATTEGSRIRDDLVARATAEFRGLVEEARAGIAQERDRAASELHAHIVDLAVMAARQVTGQEFSDPGVRELAAAVVQREGLA